MSRSGIDNALLDVIRKEFVELSATLSGDAEKLLATRAVVEAAQGMLLRHQARPTETTLDFQHLNAALNAFYEFIFSYNVESKKATFHALQEKAKKTLSKDDPELKELLALMDRTFSSYFGTNTFISRYGKSIFQALYDLSKMTLYFCRTNTVFASGEMKSVLHGVLTLFAMMSRQAFIKKDLIFDTATCAERILVILNEMDSVDALRLSPVEKLSLLFEPENIFENSYASYPNQEALLMLSWTLIREAIKTGLPKKTYQKALDYCVSCSHQEVFLGVVMRNMLSLQAATDANDVRMLNEFLDGMCLNSFLIALAKNSMKAWKLAYPINEDHLSFMYSVLDTNRILPADAYRYLQIILTDSEGDYAYSGIYHALPTLITLSVELLPDDHAVKRVVRALIEKEDYAKLANNIPEKLEGFDSLNYKARKTLGDWKGCAAIVEEKIRFYLLEKYGQNLGLTFRDGKSTAVFPTAKIQAAIESVLRAEQGASTEASLADLKQQVVATGLDYIKKNNVLVPCDGVVAADNAGLKKAMEKTVQAGAYQVAILSQKDGIVMECMVDVLSQYKNAYDDMWNRAKTIAMKIFQDGEHHPLQRARVAVSAMLSDASSLLSEQNRSGIVQTLFSDQSSLAIQREVNAGLSIDTLLSQDDKAILQAIVVGTAIFTGLAEDRLTQIASHLLAVVYGRDIQALSEAEKDAAKMLVHKANAVIALIPAEHFVSRIVENRVQHRFDCATSVAYLMGKNEFVTHGGYRHEFLMQAAKRYLSAVNAATETEMDNHGVAQLAGKSVDKAVCRFMNEAGLTFTM